jgi:hypothetical protein
MPAQVPDDTLEFLKRLNAQEAERAAAERRSREAAAATATTKAQEEQRQREAQEVASRAARNKIEVALAQALEERDRLKRQLEALDARGARLNSPPPPPAQVAPVPLPPSAAVADPAPLDNEHDADLDEEGNEGVDDEVDEAADTQQKAQPAASGSGWGRLISVGLGLAALIYSTGKPPGSPPQP